MYKVIEARAKANGCIHEYEYIQLSMNEQHRDGCNFEIMIVN